MCALFGSSRDASFIRRLNKELLHDVISQQCAFYKFQLNETKVNMYGEAAGGKYFDGPVLLNALITVNGTTSPTSEKGVDFDWPLQFAFLRDDLVDASVHPEVGDILLYQESYWEIDNTNITQFWAGKDPDFDYGGDANPLNPGLKEFGYSVSVIADAHYVPSDRINIIKSRL